MGEGATFRIYLPEHQARSRAACSAIDGKEEAARDLTGIGTILLVEDEDAGAPVQRARPAQQGLQGAGGALAAKRRSRSCGEHLAEIDLIITDVVMPRMDGPTMVKEVRARRADLQVIFISGYAEDAFRTPNRRRRGSELPPEALHPEAARRQGEGSAGAAWRAQAGGKLTI